MKDYLRWSLRQFYLLYFWPTQFAREADESGLRGPNFQFKLRAGYMLKMLPPAGAISIFSNIAFGSAYERFGAVYGWEESWAGVGLGLTLGLLLGVVSSVAFGVAGSVAFSVAGGVVLGLQLGGAGGVVVGVAFGGALGVALGGALGAAFDWVFGVKGGAAGSVVLGVALSMSFGLKFGVLVVLAFCLLYFRLITYPIDAAFSLAAYLYGKQSPEAATYAWRLCPLTWNETVWLPLPFAADLLTALTSRDRAEGFRQIAFVATERRLQKRVALRASERIAINDLQATSINQMGEVTQTLKWVIDGHAKMPGILTFVFIRFERTAQLMGQYLTLHSGHRKAEVLRQALAEIASLQQSLIVARGRLAPQLLQTVNEWRELLEGEQKLLTAELTGAREIPNPFAFGNALGETRDNTFVGRKDIVRKIEDNILGAKLTPTLLLQGARRMGKSSILNQLPRMLGPYFTAVVIDCQEAAIRESTGAALRYLSRAISVGLRRRHVQVSPLTRQALEREPFSIFKDWLEGVEQVWPGGLRLLLCFDEYERLEVALEAGWGRDFLDTLRSWIQYHPRFVLMFTGVHAFEELGPAWTDRFISARRMRVSFLAREDLKLLLTRPIPEFDLAYKDGALDAIIQATSGQPFLTQAVAFELVQYLNERNRKEATADDAEEAIARALVSGSTYFANVWSDAREEGQAILTAVARGDAPPDHPAARAWLRENDVLDDDGEFAVPMVRRWVCQTKVQLNSSPLKN